MKQKAVQLIYGLYLELPEKATWNNLEPREADWVDF